LNSADPPRSIAPLSSPTFESTVLGDLQGLFSHSISSQFSGAMPLFLAFSFGLPLRHNGGNFTVSPPWNQAAKIAIYRHPSANSAKAREDGQVSRSEDLSHIAVLGVGCRSACWYSHPFCLISLQGSIEATTRLSTLKHGRSKPAADADPTGRRHVGLGLAGMPLFLPHYFHCGRIAAAVASGGWVNSLKPLMPDFSRLNPL
jgi:hypothetical protein